MWKVLDSKEEGIGESSFCNSLLVKSHAVLIKKKKCISYKY